MSTQKTPSTFFTFVAPIALAIHEKTHGKMFPETTMVQMADETGWHTEGVCQGNEGWKGQNNFAGISPKGMIEDFPTIDAFVDAYVQTITQNAYGFPEVLDATNPELQMIRLGRSKWAGTQYDFNKTGRPGIDLVETHRANEGVINEALANARKSFTTISQPSVPATSDTTPEPQHETPPEESIKQVGTEEVVVTFTNLEPAEKAALVSALKKIFTSLNIEPVAH